MVVKTQELVTTLGKKLSQLNFTIVTAESCTSGGLAYAISLNKECSFALERGYVIYSQQAKQDLLKVKPESLQLHGAVSKEVAIEMANGALKNSCAQISVAITGIAGEDRNNEKPSAGIAWVSIASVVGKSVVFKIEAAGSRTIFGKKIIVLTLKRIIHFLNNLD